MWPEPMEMLAKRMQDVHARAAAHGRTLDYGLRVHMIVRDTEAEARDYADYIVSKLDDEYGKLIRDRAHDSISLGVAHQARARELADQFGYIEPNLWTGIGRAPFAAMTPSSFAFAIDSNIVGRASSRAAQSSGLFLQVRACLRCAASPKCAF
jgi:alkanesulfonate monooxygenase SsuD/methylene tetrahydromethanopterin reductase-like flavin-dependent oxidoreductase (luciferase family)